VALPPSTTLGSIRLNAGAQQPLAEFYERTVGLRRLESRNGIVALGADDG
jgi:catechol-2,3-dioxygenase